MPVIGDGTYDAQSSALLICYGLLQFIWVMAFLASVPILLGSCPGAWCMSRESWLDWTRAQLTTAESRAV
jgi:hypothetical protein